MAAVGVPPPPTRSASFSAGGGLGGLSSSLRERAFPSTFEDDEDDWLADQAEELEFRYNSRQNGNSHLHDVTRSRSQSLATPNRLSHNNNIASSIPVSSASPWDASGPGQRPSRYGEIGRPGRLTSSPLVPSAPSPSAVPIQIQRRSAYASDLAGSASSQVDISNMSPFVRNVDRALLEENAALRELWGSIHGHPASNIVPIEHMGGSGTTSRRHSVSVVQPRARGPLSPTLEHDDASLPFGNGGGGSMGGGLGGGMGGGLGGGFGGGFGGRQMLISDDDLASDLGSRLTFNESVMRPPQSQPSSLPVYGQGILNPQSPVERGGGGYVPMNLDRVPRTQQPGQHGGRLASGETREVSRSPGHSELHQQFDGNRQQQQQQQYETAQQQQQRYTQPTPTSAVDPGLAELGRGVPLHAVPAGVPLFVVEFKAHRQDVFYCVDAMLGTELRAGDIVIVEADRGRDLGKIAAAHVSHAQVEALQQRQAAAAAGGEPPSPGGVGGGGGGGKRDINPKRIYGKASPSDLGSMLAKSQDEAKALALCQSKVKQKKLPMEVVDAEYQWDRRKLTFYFIADKRIDFRELVRELFRCVYFLSRLVLLC